MKRFDIEGLEIEGKLYILGPCVIESEKFVISLAEDLKKICDPLGLCGFSRLRTTKRTDFGQVFRGLGVETGYDCCARLGINEGASNHRRSFARGCWAQVS